MYATLALVVQIPFVFLHMPRWRVLITASIVIAAIIHVIARMFNFLPYVAEAIPPYIYWKPQIDPWLEMMTGVAGLITTLIFIVTFFYLGWKAKNDRVIYRRSMLLAYGMISMFIGTVIRFVAFYNTPLIGFGVGAIFVAIGLALMASGILYEQRSLIAGSTRAE